LPFPLFLQFQHCHLVGLERKCYWTQSSGDAPQDAFARVKQNWKGLAYESEENQQAEQKQNPDTNHAHQTD